MKKLFWILLVSIGITSCRAQRNEEWKEDIDFWVAEVKKQHYVYRSKSLPNGFEKQVNDLKANIDSYSDQRMVVEILALATRLGDGHTYVLPWGGKTQTMTLPFRFYLFEDGLFIIDAYPGYEEWVGKKVTHFGKLSATEAMKQMARFVARDNEQGINWIGPFLLSFEGILQALNLETVGTYTLTFEDGLRDFKVVPFQPTRGIPKLGPPRKSSAQIPYYLQNVRQNYWIKSFKSNSALYVQFNQVMNDERESLVQFSSRLQDSLVAQSPRKLVIDVRHNNGGNADLLGPFLETLKQFKSKPGNEIFILTGRNTFSAAQIFISKADQLMKPLFAGELSSSKPNFVGEENEVILPNSKAICSVSNRYHESIPGDSRKGIDPQIKMVLTSVDYFNGNDPLLDVVLKR